MSVNAVRTLLVRLPRELVRRRLEREAMGSKKKLVDRYELDLVGFLNRASRLELDALCEGLGLARGASGEMRQRLWAWGAALERREIGLVAAAIQPVPLVQGARLRPPRPGAASSSALPAAREARFPPATDLPRPVPPARDAPLPMDEPASLEELLERAGRLVGVRLPARGRDKGGQGQRIADLLGLPRSSEARPDWRGEVEVKTVAAVRAEGGLWRLKDGPALSMRGVDALAKLRRVLWVVRVDESELGDSPILSWFYQELDSELAAAFEEARHLRPKGGRGTRGRGWYLRRGYFEACGLMRSLNG
jgi:hypothetical protein